MLLPFSLSGRRWREAPDEGAAPSRPHFARETLTPNPSPVGEGAARPRKQRGTKRGRKSLIPLGRGGKMAVTLRAAAGQEPLGAPYSAASAVTGA
jgi:hypothetical protein